MKRLIGIFVVGLLIYPQLIWAQTETSTACDCFCKTKDGASEIGVQENQSDCQTACKNADHILLGCYTEAQDASRPENNQLCWTNYECTSQVSTDPNTADMSYDWGGQKSSCVSGEGYCYSPQPPLTLGVAITDVTTKTLLSETSGFPEYLNVVYNWLIPAAALIAIVMIMIGGLQYAMSRGDTGRIGKAKDRIKNAVVGMILLMCAYAILNLIDPDLVTFHNLRIPQVRQVVYLDPNSKCETMAAVGLTIVPTTGTFCGMTGTVSSVDGYTGGGTPSIAVGDTCIYSSCDPTADGYSITETCLSVASAPGGYACVSCAQSYNSAIPPYDPNPDAPPPSSSACNNLLFPDPDTKDAEHYYCELFDVPLTDLTTSDSCAELVYPADNDSTSLDCDLLRSDALDGGSYSCRVYDNVWAKLADGDIIRSNEVDDLETSGTFPLLTKICEADPCGLAPPSGSCEVFTIDKEMLTAAGLVTFCAAAALATLGLATGPCILAGTAVYVSTDSAVANCANNDSFYGIMDCKDKYGAELPDCNPTW